MSAYPKQATDIEINDVADGYIVYQVDKDRVHYLNHTGALVLELCSGENSSDEIPRLIQQAFELSEPPIAEVEECLDKLRAEQIIQ